MSHAMKWFPTLRCLLLHMYLSLPDAHVVMTFHPYHLIISPYDHNYLNMSRHLDSSFIVRGHLCYLQYLNAYSRYWPG